MGMKCGTLTRLLFCPTPEEGQKQAASWLLLFFSHLQTSQRGGTYCRKKGRGVIIHSLFAIESAWDQSLAVSASKQSTKKQGEGTETGWSLEGSQERLTAREGGRGDPQRSSRSHNICGSLLAGWPEKPRVKTQTSWKFNPTPQSANAEIEVKEVWQPWSPGQWHGPNKNPRVSCLSHWAT